MTKLISLSKIKDNPFRDKKRNPIDQQKVEQIVESIGTTKEFWKGVYGRELLDGSVEIAFGHHRIDAARQAGLKEIPLEILELSDSDMLMRMTRENLRGELVLALEAVSAAVKAYGAGAVQFEALNPKTNIQAIRYAPSFIPQEKPSDTFNVSHPYTADTLARFLGGIYVKPNKTAQDLVRAALGILEMEERKVHGFSERVLHVQNGEDGTTKFLSAQKIIKIVSDIKKREVQSAAERKKIQEQEQRLIEEKIRLEKEAKEREKKFEEEKKAKQKAIVEAKRADKAEKAKKIAEQLKEKEKKAEEKKVTDSVRISEIEKKIAETRKKEAEQAKKDSYAPIKRDVEYMLRKLEVIPTENNALRDEVKALSRKPLTPEDRQRLRNAAINAGNWFIEFVGLAFIPPNTSRKKEKK